MKKNIDIQIYQFLKVKFDQFPEIDKLGLEILQEARR